MFLESRGKRWTRERAAVAMVVYEFQARFDVARIVETLSLRKESPRVSLATVYWLLDNMVTAGLLRVSSGIGGEKEFEHTE